MEERKAVHEMQIAWKVAFFTSTGRKYCYFLALTHFSVPLLPIPLFQRVPVTAQSLRDLASFYEQKGRHEEAASLLQSVRVTHERTPESDHPL